MPSMRNSGRKKLFVCQSLASEGDNRFFRGNRKYDQRFADIKEFLDFLRLSPDLITNHSTFSSQKDLDEVFACAFTLCEKKPVSDWMQRAIDDAIPFMLVSNCDTPCDFIEIIEKSEPHARRPSYGYRFSCVKRDLEIRNGGKREEDIRSMDCLKNRTGAPHISAEEKFCNNSGPEDDDLILYIAKAIYDHPSINGVRHHGGKIPIFTYSFLLDYILYHLFLGADIAESYHRLRQKMEAAAKASIGLIEAAAQGR